MEKSKWLLRTISRTIPLARLMTMQSTQQTGTIEMWLWWSSSSLMKCKEPMRTWKRPMTVSKESRVPQSLKFLIIKRHHSSNGIRAKIVKKILCLKLNRKDYILTNWIILQIIASEMRSHKINHLTVKLKRSKKPSISLQIATKCSSNLSSSRCTWLPQTWLPHTWVPQTWPPQSLQNNG